MLMRTFTRSWFRFNARFENLLALRRGWLSRFPASRRPRPDSKKRSYQLVLESLEDIAVPGSTAAILANASISVFGYELLNLHPDSSATLINDAASSAGLLEVVSSSATPPADVTLDNYWQQDISSSSFAPENDMDAPDHAEASAAGASAAPALRSSLTGLDLSNTLVQDSGDPFSLPAAAPSGSGHGGGSGAGLTDNGSARGAAGATGAAAEGNATRTPSGSGRGGGGGAGLLDNSSAGGAAGAMGGGAAGAGTSGGSTASAASAVRSSATAPQASTRTFAPGTALSQVNLQAWSQSLHGQNAGHQGLAGSSMLDPSALNRHTGAGTAVTRHTGAPFAGLSHGGQAGLGFGVASPSPGQAGPALSAIADQAAAHVADTRGTLTSATQHADLVAQTTDNPATNLAASAGSVLSVLPALRGASAATPGSTHKSTPATRNLLAEHLAATPVHVHDPETFTDSDNGNSSFTLTGQGSDSTGSFTLTETGAVSSTWSENGSDTTDNWTFTETGSFTVTLTYTNGTTKTSTVPINVQQSSVSGATAPTGFDLDSYNQSQIYGAGSVATYTITASGSETYSANDTGTITDDQGDSFTFTVGDHGGDGFSENDGGNDTPNSAGGENTSGTFNDSDNGSETDTTTVTGTLAGGGSINYSDTDTSGYTDSDLGNDSETGGTDSGNDNFNDTVTGSDTPSLTITEPVSDSGFTGTLTYTDTASDSYNNSNQGNANDNAGSDSGTDNLDDSDSGTDDTTVSVNGSVSDPASGFSGTISYSDHEAGSYHDHDHGPETDTAGAASETDTFNDGDNGSETIRQSASGSINAPDGSFRGTMSFSDTSGGIYSDSDIGAVTDSSNGSETGSDNYVDTDSGSDNLNDTVSGAIANPASGFSGTANFSDMAGGSYHDSDQGPETETAAGNSDSDNFAAGDSGNETVTESVNGSVNAPDGSFVGTVGNSETSTSNYHDEDDGNANEAANGTEAGTDNFDFGDGGGDTTTVTANGRIDGTATVNMSDTIGDTYSEDDGGSDTEAATGETEQDTYTGNDNGHDDFSYSAAGTLPGTDTTFSDSDTSHDLFDTADSDTASDTANTDSDTVTTDDNVNDGWTQSTTYDNAESDTTTSTVTQNDHAVNSTASANGTTTSNSTAGTRDVDGANWRDVDTNYNMNGAVTRVRTSTSNWTDTKVVSAAGTAETVTDLDTATYVVHGRLSVSFNTTNNWQTAANGTLLNFNYESIETDYATDGSYMKYDYQKVWNGSEYVETETDTFTDAQGNTRPIEPPQVTDEPGSPPSSVGEPGFWESMIPIWGSGRSAIANFQQGNYGWAAFHGVMAVSDVFLVKSLVTAAGKGAVAVGSKIVCKVTKSGCFVAGTSVATESGQKPIETVREGDRVWSCDLTTGDWRLCSVLETYTNEYIGDLIEVQVAGSCIESTYHHPVWVVEGEDLAGRPWPDHVASAREPLATVPGRWVDAGNLRVGDVVLLQSGSRATIERLRVRQTSTSVYNFEVDELHNYAVGVDRILVHNNSPCVTAAARLAANNAAGKAAEKAAAAQLIAEGNTILGSQVSARTAAGRRVIDHLIQTPTGEILAVEVKSGNAVRGASQLAKDSAMATKGGKLVGKNAPDALRGQTLPIRTIVRRMP